MYRPFVPRALTSLALGLSLVACSSGDSSSNSKPAPDASSDAEPPDAGADAADGGSEQDAADGAATTAMDLSSTPGSVWEAESHLAIAPSGRSVAVWMSLTAAGLKNGFAISEDRGASWSPPQAMVEKTLGDPVLSARKDGTFFYGYLDGTCGPSGCSNGHVYVARLAPGASTFTDPVDISPADPLEFYDKPWLMTAADDSLVAIFNGRIGTYPDNVDTIVAARSTDGTSWTRSYVVPKQPQGQIAGIPHACASNAAARIWTVYVDVSSPVAAALRWSDDHGASWPSENFSTDFALPAEVSTIQAYDLRCVGEGQEVWVMYGLASGPATATGIPPLDEIHVSHSTDAGKSFVDRAVITRAGTRFLRPEIIRDGSGVLHVIAYTGTAEGDPNGAVRRWRSTDGGKQFVEESPVHSPILFTGERGGTNAWIGDYSGLAVDQNELFVTFVDNASLSSHVTFVRLMLDP